MNWKNIGISIGIGIGITFISFLLSGSELSWILGIWVMYYEFLRREGKK